METWTWSLMYLMYLCVPCQAVTFYVVRYQIKKEREFLFSIFEGWIRMSSLVFLCEAENFSWTQTEPDLVSFPHFKSFFLFSDRKI